MSRLRYRRLARSMALIMTAALLVSFPCKAADSVDNLREAKKEAWKQCKWNSIGTTVDFETALQEIDGAVQSDASAYILVEDWSDWAIPAKKETTVFGSKNGEVECGILQPDSIVKVLSKGKKRTLIQTGYLSGYVENTELLFGKKAKKQADKVCPAQVITDYADIPVRQKADGDSNIIKYMEQRNAYSILEEESGWYQITIYDDMKGFVKETDVKVVRKTHLGVRPRDKNNPQEAYNILELSEEERKCLVAITYCEAGSESFAGQVAVASTVINRVEDENFPNTVEEVILDAGQFVPVQTGWYEEVLESVEAVGDSCYEAVDCVIQGKRGVDSLYFNKNGEGQQIGSHWFY